MAWGSILRSSSRAGIWGAGEVARWADEAPEPGVDVRGPDADAARGRGVVGGTFKLAERTGAARPCPGGGPGGGAYVCCGRACGGGPGGG